MAIERLNLQEAKYSGPEAAIHMARYAMVRNLCKNRKVLDIACGEGYGSRLLLDWGATEVVGLDISSASIEAARRNFETSGLRYLSGDAGKADELLAGEQFDLIVSFETLEHIAEPEIYLSAIANLCAPEGIVIISCPNDWTYFPDADQQNEHHARKYRFEEFIELVTARIGSPTTFGVGTPCFGWVNLPVHDSAVWHDAKIQKDMLHYREERSLLLPAETHSLTVRNGHYYWAAWGIDSNELVCLATFPISGDTLRLIVKNDDPVSLALLTKRWNALTAIPKSIAFIARRVMHRVKSNS